MLNSTQQLEAPLSQKQNTFSGFLIAFLKCALNLEQFEKKDEYPSLVSSRIIDSESFYSENKFNAHFRNARKNPENVFCF